MTEAANMDMELRFFTQDDSFPFYIQYGEHGEDMFMHSHTDFYELVIVLTGKAKHAVNNESFAIKKGDVFVVGSEIRHGYTHVENFRICNIMFNPEKLLSADYDIKKSSGFHSLFLISPQINAAEGFKNRMTLNAESFIKLSGIIASAIQEYKSDKPGKRTILLSYFMQIVVELSRVYVDSTAPSKRLGELDGIAAAAAYMESNYMNDITAGQLLDISHYSQRHFIRLFSTLYKIPPQKYLLNIRLRQARSLLRDSSLHITEIATRCGFNDANYFSRAFKKAVGMTPNEFRANM